jgi:hypothetical protein
MTIPVPLRRRPAATVLALVLALFLAPLACKRQRRVTVQTIEEAPPLASVVATGDPHVAAQLLSGFYGIEQNAWRWTAGKFSVLLRPPHSAASRGATLELNFSLPETSIAKLKAVSLSASINGTTLAPESYTQAGPFTYSRDVPVKLLSGDAVKVDFSLDRTMPPTAVDRRELGVVVSMVGFRPK